MCVERTRLLILDLDETLIYATEHLFDRPADLRIENYYIYCRPYLAEFLSDCCRIFDIAFWTTGSRSYAELLVGAILPPSCSAKFIWAADECSLLYDKELDDYVLRKDLHEVTHQGYSLQDVLVVDDRPQALKNAFHNLLRVRPFRGDRDDIELYLLLRYLREVGEVDNIQGLEKREWRSVALKLEDGER
jgi:RNA polymerase II subunit A small phosphatase-like protein